MPAYLPDQKTFDNDSKIFGETHLPKMLKRAHFLGKSSIKTLFMVDSLDMNDEHRARISKEIEDSNEDPIIITHGTDTMPETARFLKRNNHLADKTIILTSAMLPFSVGEESDALFNLGNSIAYAQSLSSGVYVAMNGQTFEADNVRKDVEAGVFRPIQ
jgi:L-asparaginase